MNVPSRTVAGGVALLLAAAPLAGCSDDRAGQTEPGSSPQTSASPAQEAPSSAATTGPTSPSTPDPPAVTEVPKPYTRVGAAADIVRADDGTTFVAFGGRYGNDVTTYRLYDRTWRPLTPLLSVDVALEVERGTPNRFVALATRSNRQGRYTLHQWVTLNQAGRVRPVAHQADRTARARRPRPGDRHLQADAQRGSLAYRPATNTVFKKPRPSWDTIGHSWYVDADGICAMSSGPLPDGAIHVSRDEGRTFATIPVGDILPASSGPRLQSCEVSKQRIVVGTGGEYPRWLHTLDRTGTQLLSSRELGDLLDPYNWDTLPDGRLVTGTNRPGLMVAVDSTNTEMDYRPGPISMNSGVTIVDDLLIRLAGRGLEVSADAGLTWRHVQLVPPAPARR